MSNWYKLRSIASQVVHCLYVTCDECGTETRSHNSAQGDFGFASELGISGWKYQDGKLKCPHCLWLNAQKVTQ